MIGISVVIPARNREKTLPYCLESVLGQTCKPSEVIVVDDHSTDGTQSIVESYAARGVRYARLMDGTGAQAARNLGILLSRQEWIAFQDSDDRWRSDKLAKQVLALEREGRSPKTLIHSDCEMVDSVTGESKPVTIPSFNGDCHARLLRLPGPLFPSILVHKSRLEEISFLDESCPSYQEWDTAIRLAKVCHFVHVREPLFQWVRHNAETISKDHTREIEGHDYIIAKHASEIARLYGQRGLHKARIDVLAKAMRFGHFDKAAAIIDRDPGYAAMQLARLFLKFRSFPRGAGRLLTLAAKLPF